MFKQGVTKKYRSYPTGKSVAVTETHFSAREQDVITLLLQGKSNKEIALTLGIANRTVESHLSNIYAKLGVTSRTEAVIELSEHRFWKSTGKTEVANQGNPQLNKVSNGITLIKVIYYPFLLWRHSMKTVVRIIILVLAILLIVTLIFGVFALLRQPSNFSMILGLF